MDNNAFKAARERFYQSFCYQERNVTIDMALECAIEEYERLIAKKAISIADQASAMLKQPNLYNPNVRVAGMAWSEEKQQWMQPVECSVCHKLSISPCDKGSIPPAICRQFKEDDFFEINPKEVAKEPEPKNNKPQLVAKLTVSTPIDVLTNNSMIVTLQFYDDGSVRWKPNA